MILEIVDKAALGIEDPRDHDGLAGYWPSIVAVIARSNSAAQSKTKQVRLYRHSSRVVR